MGLQFDHIAIGCTDLAEGTAWVEEQLGVALRPGGKHVQFGTYNTLLGMGDLYLEVIAKDPDAPAIDRPTWFDLDNFKPPARLHTWIASTTDIQTCINAAKEIGVDYGEPVSLTRGNLSWQMV